MLQLYIAFVVLNFVGIMFFQPFTVSGDSYQYVEIARFLLGEEGGALHPERILKPLGPLVASLFGVLTGDVWSGFLIVNSIFYFLIAILIFFFLRALLGNSNRAFFGSVFYLASYPLLRHGVAYMVDMPGWFFALLTFYYTLLFYDTRRGRYAFLAGLAAGIGFLFKEYAAAGILFFLLILLFLKNAAMRERMRAILLFLVPFLATAGAWQAWSYLVYNATYLMWYQAGGAGGYTVRDVPFVIKSLTAVFLLGWIPAALGWRMLFRERMALREHVLVKLMLVPSFSFLLWQAASSRIYFVAGPLLAALAGISLEHLFRKSRALFWGVMALVIGANYWWFIYGDTVRSLVWPWIQA